MLRDFRFIDFDLQFEMRKAVTDDAEALFPIRLEWRLLNRHCLRRETLGPRSERRLHHAAEQSVFGAPSQKHRTTLVARNERGAAFKRTDSLRTFNRKR